MVDPDAPTGGAKPIPEVSEDGIKSQKKGENGNRREHHRRHHHHHMVPHGQTVHTWFQCLVQWCLRNEFPISLITS